MPSIVRIADPRGSTPRPLSLVGVGVGGVIAGLLLVQVSLAAERPEAGATDSALAAAVEPGDVGQAPLDHASADAELAPADQAAPPEADPDGLAAEADAGVDDAQADGTPEDPEVAEVAPDAEDVPDAAPEPPASADSAADGAPNAGPERTVTRGRVAYFQCPGDRCARDHGLEGEVFRALERASGCVGGPGEGDVRVTVEGGAVTDVRFRDRGTRGLDIGALDRCLTPPLRRISGSPLPGGVVVSFRFDVD